MPPRAATSHMPIASVEAPREAIVRSRPDVQQAANAWMKQQIRTHLGDLVDPATDYLDPSAIRLVAFANPAAAAALDTRYLISEAGLDEVAMHQRPHPRFIRDKQRWQAGIYPAETLLDPQAANARFSIATAGDPTLDRSVQGSVFPASRLLDAMNGLTQHPVNELSSLFKYNHVPVTPEYKREYVRDYVRQVTGHDVDPDNTFLVRFDQDQHKTPHPSADIFDPADIMGGQSLTTFFEQHLPPTRKLPDPTERLRLVSRSDLAHARRVSAGRGDAAISSAPTWYKPPLPVGAFLDMMAKTPSNGFFSKVFEKEKMGPYWAHQQNLLTEFDEARAYSYAQQAVDARHLAAEHFTFLDRVFTDDVRSDNVRVYPLNMAGSPTIEPFSGMQIEDLDSGLRILYYPGGVDPIRAFPLDKDGDASRQLQEVEDWVSGKLHAASWRRTVTSSNGLTPVGRDALLYQHLYNANATPLEGNVFKALVTARIHAELAHPEAFARSATRSLSMEEVRKQWITTGHDDFAAMDMAAQSGYLLDQYPPGDALASEYARSFVAKHFNKDINPDTTFLTVFPEKSFFRETGDRIISGRLLDVLSPTQGYPASTVELEQRVSITDLFRQNWAPRDGLLMDWSKTGMFRILSQEQIAPYGERHNYRDATSVIDPAALFKKMTSLDGNDNQFVPQYRALVDTYWDRNAGHVAHHARQMALRTVDDSPSGASLTGRDRAMLRNVFDGTSERPAGVKVFALNLLGMESVNAQVIVNDVDNRKYLYLPGASRRKLLAFPGNISAEQIVLHQIGSERSRNAFLQASFSSEDARRLSTSLDKVFAGNPFASSAPLNILRQQHELQGDPFAALAALAAAKDKSDVGAATRDNTQRRRTTNVELFGSAVPLPLVGNIVGLAAGDARQRGTALKGIGLEIAGMVLGAGIGAQVGSRLTSLAGPVLGALAAQGADTVVNFGVPLAGGYLINHADDATPEVPPRQGPAWMMSSPSTTPQKG